MAEQFIYLGSTKIQEGSGSPETTVTSQKGSLFLRNDGGVGTTLYIKETGTGNTGWSALGSSSFDPAAATAITFTGGQGVINGDSDPLFINGVKINGGTDGSYGGSILIQGGGGVGLRGLGPYGGSRLDISGCDLINGHTQNNVLYCRNADSGNNDGAGFIIQLGDKSGSGVSGSFLIRDNLAVELFRIAYDGTITSGPVTFTTGLTTCILGPTDTSLVIQSSANGSGIARAIDILSANGGAATRSGADINIHSGSGNTTGSGGFINVTTGNGGTSGSGGDFYLTCGSGGGSTSGGWQYFYSGDGGSTAGASGSFYFSTGVVTDGNTGDFEVNLTDAVGTDRTGGSFKIQLAAGTGSGASGSFLIRGAAGVAALNVAYDGTVTGPDGSTFNINAFTPTSSNGNNLTLRATAATSVNGDGGEVKLYSGNATGAGDFIGGGVIALFAGNGGDTSVGGSITRQSGNGGSTSGSSGSITDTIGSTTDGNIGSWTVIMPSATGTNRSGGVAAFQLGAKTGSGTDGYFLIKDAASVDLFKVDYTGIIKIQNGPTLQSGTGTPEGAVTATVGSIFIRTDGGAGTSVYFKESGAGNTGWVGK